MVYTLGFIRYNDEILMINRLKQPWQGCWNGVGGKIEPNESLKASMIREIEEETGIKVLIENLVYKGKLTWSPNDGSHLHIFLIDTFEKIQTPILTSEGILDYRKIDWIVDKDNLGVASNIPYFLPKVLEDKLYHYHCIFEGNRLIDVIIEPLEEPHA